VDIRFERGGESALNGKRRTLSSLDQGQITLRNSREFTKVTLPKTEEDSVLLNL
jgi:environmental stress-induced protein Ves